jgi:hypothetical protein
MTRADADVVSAVVGHVADAAVAGADAGLRLGGVPAPAVHSLCADLDPPYVGYVACREFAPGADAARAVGTLGRMPAAVAATDVVVTWEFASLRAALEPSGPPGPTGIAVVVASFTGHEVRWFPYRTRPAGAEFEVVWGRPSVVPSGRLPLPVEELLRTWRSLGEDDVSATADMLERAGYRVRWAARS